MTATITRGLAAIALVTLTFTGLNAPAQAKERHDENPIVQMDHGAKSQYQGLISHKPGTGGGGGGTPGGCGETNPNQCR